MESHPAGTGHTGCPQSSVLGPVLFNVLFDGLDEGIEGTFSQFADNTLLGWQCGSAGGQEALQGDLGRLDRWPRPPYEVQQGPVLGPAHGSHQSQQHCGFGAERLRSCLVGKGLGGAG